MLHGTQRELQPEWRPRIWGKKKQCGELAAWQWLQTALVRREESGRGRVHRRHRLLHRRQLIAWLENDRWASLVEGSSCTASGPARHLLRFGMMGGWCALSLLVTPPSSLGLELKEWFPFAAKRRIRAALIACNKQRICLVEVTKAWGLAHTGENDANVPGVATERAWTDLRVM